MATPACQQQQPPKHTVTNQPNQNPQHRDTVYSWNMQACTLASLATCSARVRPACMKRATEHCVSAVTLLALATFTRTYMPSNKAKAPRYATTKSRQSQPDS